MVGVVKHADDRLVMAAPSIVLLLCAVVAVVAVTALAYVQYRRSQRLESTAEFPTSADEAG